MTVEKMLRADYQALKSALWSFIRQFCLLEGYVIVKRGEATCDMIPENKYSLLARWLNEDLGKKLFPYTGRPIREVADELTRYFGWEVKVEPLRQALNRLNLRQSFK